MKLECAKKKGRSNGCLGFIIIVEVNFIVVLR